MQLNKFFSPSELRKSLNMDRDLIQADLPQDFDVNEVQAELPNFDVNEVQAELCSETPYREKFMVTICPRTRTEHSTEYLFFQMLNTQHPDGSYVSI
jgi:hypothetical protein